LQTPEIVVEAIVFGIHTGILISDKPEQRLADAALEQSIKVAVDGWRRCRSRKGML